MNKSRNKQPNQKGIEPLTGAERESWLNFPTWYDPIREMVQLFFNAPTNVPILESGLRMQRDSKQTRKHTVCY